MSAFLDGIGKVVGKIVDYIPGRTEGLKNKKERLLNERKILTSKEFSASGSRRVIAIDAELRIIEKQLENSARD